MPIKGQGKLVIDDVTLNNVLVVPDLEFYLISVSALSKKGCEVVFTDREAQICINKECILRFIHEGSLYTMITMKNLEDHDQSSVLISTYEKNSLKHLHKRMGHISNALLGLAQDILH